MVVVSSPSTGGPDKNTLRMVSKQFKDDAEEGTRSIKWKYSEVNDDKAYRPISLMNILASPVRDRDGRFKDRLPNLKSINCNGLDTLTDLNGCPSGLEVLSCGHCELVQSLAPLAACTNLRKLDLNGTTVTNLKPLMGCVKLEWLDIRSTPVSDPCQAPIISGFLTWTIQQSLTYLPSALTLFLRHSALAVKKQKFLT